ncbi:ribonuclease HI [Saccharopolyspora sp. NFXS83]|uniref:ribonuclease HI n=1 Tax=Saccharopolyspora sp. NFXS83 TaxID=2993560 RepID=UPI00224B6C32|nr:ribonuclease HI [Saccharopolyspora sp. NFXS83]MCX2733965.1 ribonuclease HI [Saccharopolyspora sp. NFXS83]
MPQPAGADEPDQKRVELFTDGACSGNPGPGGWGVVLRYGDHERELHGGERATTNNKMELTAVIEGLAALTRPMPHVRVFSDSTYVLKGISEWMKGWKRNGWKTSAKQPVKNAELWQRLDAEVQRHGEVEWNWVKGHSGHPENERADKLACKGRDESRS